MRTKESIESIFYSKVFPEPNTGCWIWAGAIRSNGYGAILKRTYGFVTPHRYSYFIHKGDFDRSLHVLHKCDVPSCVNPDHLFLGTHQDNMDDMYRKDRRILGIDFPNHILTDQLVKMMRNDYSTGLFTQKQIREKYNLTKTLCNNVLTNKRWKHVK